MAQPARHRERAGKLYPPAIQTSVSEHSPGSNRGGMKVQGQVTRDKANQSKGCVGHLILPRSGGGLLEPIRRTIYAWM